MSLLKRLLHGCFFFHDDRRERDAKGRYLLVCQACGSRRQILKGQKAKYRDRSAKVVRLERKRA
jgi:hypothetical protein